MTVCELPGLVSGRRRSAVCQNLIGRIEVGEIIDFGKDHSPHVGSNARNRGNWGLNLLHKSSYFAFNFLDLSVKFSNQTDRVFQFHGLHGNPCAHGIHGSVSNFNGLFFAVMPSGSFAEQIL